MKAEGERLWWGERERLRWEGDGVKQQPEGDAPSPPTLHPADIVLVSGEELISLRYNIGVI